VIAQSEKTYVVKSFIAVEQDSKLDIRQSDLPNNDTDCNTARTRQSYLKEVDLLGALNFLAEKICHVLKGKFFQYTFPLSHIICSINHYLHQPSKNILGTIE